MMMTKNGVTRVSQDQNECDDCWHEKFFRPEFLNRLDGVIFCSIL